MVWSKIPIQEQWTNALDVNASGFVIKCYLPGTTTATPISIDKNGSTTVSTVTLNADGLPEVSGNEVAIYIDREFKFAVYENQDDADNDVNAYFGPIDNVPQTGRHDYFSDYLNNKEVAHYAEARTNLADGVYKPGDKFWVNGYPDPWEVQSGTEVTANDDGYTLVATGGGAYAVSLAPGSNRMYITTEQQTNYTMTPNRHIFGEEYLWGLHKHIIDTNNSQYIEFLWSGDSTTAGDNAGSWKVDVLGESFSAHYGLAYFDHINKGHSGKDAVEWDDTYVAADILSNPNARVYITRWGINDGAIHGSVSTYIAAMDSGLAKLRAWKDVSDLTIVVMAPSSTYDEPNNRSTRWYEQIIPQLRKICRKYQAVFFDTYSIWQDARQGALAGNPLWLDDPFGDGRGIHPDAAFNHQIVWRVMKMILEPVMRRPNLSTTTFTNTQEVHFLPYASTVPNSYTVGRSLWTCKTANGWPVDGKLDVYRNGNKVVEEITFTGVDDTQNDPTTLPKLLRWGDATLNTWTKWYNLAVAPTLTNSWITSNSKTPKYVHHHNGIVSIMGQVVGGTSGTSCFTLPTECRPAVTRVFPVMDNSATLARVEVTSAGLVNVYSATACNIDGITFSAGN